MNSTMNPIEQLNRNLAAAFPDASFQITQPVMDEGYWWLEVKIGTKHFTVQWRKGGKFGISDVNTAHYGEAPDEWVDTLVQATNRITELLQSKQHPSPRLGALLARLREIRGVTQGELAERLRVRQATVSGFEHRDDVQLSTLKRIIESLGASLEIFAVLDDRRFRIISANDGTDNPDESLLWSSESRRTDRVESVRPRGATFSRLQSAGLLSSATKKAREIHERRSVMAIR